MLKHCTNFTVLIFVATDHEEEEEEELMRHSGYLDHKAQKEALQ